MRKFRSSQTAILVMNWVKHSFFLVSIVKNRFNPSNFSLYILIQGISKPIYCNFFHWVYKAVLFHENHNSSLKQDFQLLIIPRNRYDSGQEVVLPIFQW